MISVTELISQARSIRQGLYGRCRAPFFAHLGVPMMADFVKSYKAKYEQYPSDWAVMSYDGVYALRQGIVKAGTGTIETDRVKEAMKELPIDTTRGRLHFRKIDNQLNCSAYFCRVADDPQYPYKHYYPIFQIYIDMTAQLYFMNRHSMLPRIH